ncbi:N-acetylmuramoyl-L-alanine amidase [Streptobacillus felis]|uniref:N-acetylmuramoyl-L-alanine amidase n=1 Tax=Streptobacillus felis TaxID=1384509 RepID=A0A7Z0T7Y9_9FUSO|nr:N-acetylmuramoyl-L-alanine amidase [Streptobacillus felis]NYV27334.1 N-acetylmuramoyl-L-alanine amidase [Streptobacillus felis]
MFNKIKKTILLFGICVSSLTFSTILQDVKYQNGEFILKFDSKISKPTISKSTITSNNIHYNVTELNLKNTKISEEVLKQININDEFFKYIMIDEVTKDIIGIYTYSQYGYNSIITYSDNEIKIKKSKVEVPKKISPLTKKQLAIVLDAGHGGHDSGARGHGKLEKDIALEVTLKLANNLKRDHKVILTRGDDRFITLSERPKIGNKNSADLFVSIHLNAASNETANGAEIFYFSKETNPYTSKLIELEEKYDEAQAKKVSIINQILGDFFINRTKEKSANLARVILDNYSKQMNFRKRGIFGANFAVLRGSESASILIELGFITNEYDNSKLASETGQMIAVNAIADAIRENFEE